MYIYGLVIHIFIWSGLQELNRGLKLAKLLCSHLYQQPIRGVPPRTRTLTDGFGDRGAAITPEIPDTLLGMCVLKHTGRGVPSADSTELISSMF